MTKEHLSEQHLAAWRTFLKAHATIMDLIERDLVTAKRPPLSSYDVLIELYEAPEHRLRMHELAERVVLSRSGLMRLVDRLETDGLLTRDRCGTDRRWVYDVVTEVGIASLQETWPIFSNVMSE